MARSLLVAPVADHSALARTCLGLLRALDRRGVKVAFVKPVAQPSADGGPDRSAELVAAVTALRPPEPLSIAQLEQQLGEGELEVVLEKIVAAWEPVLHRDPQSLHEGDMSRRVRDVAVFAAGIPGGLDALDTGRLVVVPGDRHDVIMAAYLTELSGTRLAGLLLSTGTAPDPRISDLTRGTAAAGLPVLLVEDDTYHTATRVRDLDPGLPVDDTERIDSVTDTIADALDPSWLRSLTAASRSRRLSPAAFRYQLTELARAADALVVLPEGTEPRTIRAAVACAERRIARCLLLGSPDEVAAQAAQLGLNLPEGVTVVDPRTVAERYVAPLVELRRHKGWSEDVGREH